MTNQEIIKCINERCKFHAAEIGYMIQSGVLSGVEWALDREHALHDSPLEPSEQNGPYASPHNSMVILGAWLGRVIGTAIKREVFDRADNKTPWPVPLHVSDELHQVRRELEASIKAEKEERQAAQDAKKLDTGTFVVVRLSNAHGACVAASAGPGLETMEFLRTNWGFRSSVTEDNIKHFIETAKEGQWRYVLLDGDQHVVLFKSVPEQSADTAEHSCAGAI